jgi:DNA polymerase III delta prime subunit
MQNLPFTLSLGISLLLLTILVWVLSRQRFARRVLLPSEQDRLALVRTLRQEYTRQLNHSLQGAAMMELHLHERTDVTLSSAQFVFRRTEAGEEHALPAGTSIVQAYDDAGHGLLILGEPGAGKTTLLLALAQELLTRAEGDLARPIPVIVNLSSWAIKQPPLASWLIEQLQLVYQVPTRLSKAWLEHDQWLLLLDGLDEVEASARAGCMKAINTYHGEHFTSLVVCTRTHEYLSQEARLALPNAVVVQSLQEEQVTAYLKGIGKPMAAVRAALRTNPTFQRIITTPLMLNVVILAYRDEAIKDLPSLGSAEQQQHQIFDRYVERMLARPVTQGAFKPQQIQYWLTWLAQVMMQQHLSEFYLEHLQPTWLPSNRSQARYSLLFELVFGLLGGLVFGLLGGLLLGLLGGLYFGLVFGLYFGLLRGFSKSQITEHLRIKPNQGIRSSGRSALFAGFITMLLLGLIVGPLLGLLGGLVDGLLLGLIVGLLFGGTAYFQHYLLRYFLWRSGAMPWHYVRFLEEASERILLLKVGGGYRFIHPLFLDYFASQRTAIPSNSTEQPPPQQPPSSSPLS